jgi:isopentenyl diphosphate isomerase/L-lactate dehydrogenase-like FMN-dependent dehydrogenase
MARSRPRGGGEVRRALHALDHVDLFDRGRGEPTRKPFWFQVYTLKDDDFMKRLFARAKDAKCSALVITVDLQIMGQRHRDMKNGLSAPPKLTPASILNLATKIPWGLEMLQTKRRFFGNVVGHAEGVSDPASLGSWTAEAFDPSLNWERIKEFRSWWDGPVILKGVLDEEDAKMAANVGADAIVVSNHGGGSLTVRSVPSACCRGSWMPWATRSRCISTAASAPGQDVLKALALGAKGTMIGRAFVYGLGAMGQAGVTKALEVIHKELDTTMALCGERDVAIWGGTTCSCRRISRRAGPEPQPAARCMRGSSTSGTATTLSAARPKAARRPKLSGDEAQERRAHHEPHVAQQHRAADRERPARRVRRLPRQRKGKGRDTDAPSPTRPKPR